ncbi:hypothetical protein LTR66_007636 [Elasticomyces elasticus]|nr:hypothetical protein LTR66_007636 [Elasticomyces elasticus]
MPEPLTQQDIDTKTDPTVARQWDTETPMEKQWEEFYGIVDKLKIGLLGTYRQGVGPVARSMAVAKRTGPDFLFLANNHSKKFSDLEKLKEVTVTFQNSSNQDWVSVTGEAVTTSNSDPRIKEVWTRSTAVWFGDLGDGVHNGKPEDPRMTLIEVRAKYISYWKAQVGALGFGKEIVQSMITGEVANTGALRQFEKSDIEQARARDSSMSS